MAMIDRKIYIVIGATGEYSDHSEWPVTWCKTLPEAESVVAKLNAEAAAFKQWDREQPDDWSYDERDRRMKAMTDPSFACDYTGTTYHVWTVSDTLRRQMQEGE
jgi:hypothetical protein